MPLTSCPSISIPSTVGNVVMTGICKSSKITVNADTIILRSSWIIILMSATYAYGEVSYDDDDNRECDEKLYPRLDNLLHVQSAIRVLYAIHQCAPSCNHII